MGLFDSISGGAATVHAGIGLDEKAFAAVQERLRGRLLRVFVRRAARRSRVR
jgi:hypothetical protein